MAATKPLLPLPEPDDEENGVSVTKPAAEGDNNKNKNPIVSAVEGIFSLAVGFTAEFMSAVLNHPQVQEAAAGVMVIGMNKFMAQPDLGERVLEMDDNMGVYHEAMAAKTGADMPMLASGFWKGLSGKGQEKDVQKS